MTTNDKLREALIEIRKIAALTGARSGAALLADVDATAEEALSTPEPDGALNEPHSNPEIQRPRIGLDPHRRGAHEGRNLPEKP